MLVESATELCQQSRNNRQLFDSVVRDCVNMNDQFMHIDILEKKIALLNMMADEVLKNKEAELQIRASNLPPLL